MTMIVNCDGLPVCCDVMILHALINLRPPIIYPWFMCRAMISGYVYLLQQDYGCSISPDHAIYFGR
jgi:hypothetical protein